MQNKNRQNHKSRQIFPAAALLAAGAVLIAAGCAGYFFSHRKPPEIPEPPPSATPTPFAAPEKTPEVTAAPAPPLIEEDGVTYLNLDGTGVLLVNKEYPLPEDYGAEDPAARDALEKMFAAAAGDGIRLFIVSGFRSYETQRGVHEYWAGLYGREQAERVSAKPGHSEHQAGLAYDINSLETAFRDTAEYAWLAGHCAEYGFISRYLEGKEWATGYSYEPWHFRYIGNRELAGKIMASGLSLEEYAGLAKEENMGGEG